ncbi:MAG: ATP-binding protein [Gaiellaceae bacterium]
MEELLELVGPHLVTDANGTIIEANTAAGGLLGCPPRHLAGKRLEAFVPREARRDFRSWLARASTGAARLDFDLRLEQFEGSIFDAAVIVARVGGAGGLRWLIRDVTKERQAERALLELNAHLERHIGLRTAELERAYAELETRRAYFETVVQRIPAGVMLAEAPSGRITLVNDAALAVLGRGVPNARSLGEYSGAEGFRRDGSRVKAREWPLPRALRGEVVTAERLTLVRPGSEPRVVEINCSPVRDPNGRIVAAVSIFLDVTERGRREQAAYEFTANAAHELRTPVAAIISAVEVLQAGAKDVPAERDRFLAHVEREADRLARLVRALLVLARFQSGTEPARLELVRLRPILDEAVRSVRPAAGVELAVRCRSDVAALANRDLLEQAVLNLVVNAVRYTSQGRIGVTGRRRRGKTFVEVVDTGRGMTSAQVERAAERFYRGVAPDRDGFGLGLAIARQAIEAMGGTLELESQPGQGTTARIELRGAQVVRT